jgi:hypothetical protein
MPIFYTLHFFSDQGNIINFYRKIMYSDNYAPVTNNPKALCKIIERVNRWAPNIFYTGHKKAKTNSGLVHHSFLEKV